MTLKVLHGLLGGQCGWNKVLPRRLLDETQQWRRREAHEWKGEAARETTNIVGWMRVKAQPKRGPVNGETWVVQAHPR